MLGTSSRGDTGTVSQSLIGMQDAFCEHTFCRANFGQCCFSNLSRASDPLFYESALCVYEHSPTHWVSLPLSGSSLLYSERKRRPSLDPWVFMVLGLILTCMLLTIYHCAFSLPILNFLVFHLIFFSFTNLEVSMGEPIRLLFFFLANVLNTI